MFDLRRFERKRDDLVAQKVDQIRACDDELRALELALDERRDLRDVREPGIGGTCPRCFAVFGSADRFCSNCGAALGGAVQGPAQVPLAPTLPPPAQPAPSCAAGTGRSRSAPGRPARGGRRRAAAVNAVRPSPTTPGALLCPRCGNTLRDDQGWCLECGLAARTRVHPPSSWRVPVVLTCVLLALLGAAIAVALVTLLDTPESTPRPHDRHPSRPPSRPRPTTPSPTVPTTAVPTTPTTTSPGATTSPSTTPSTGTHAENLHGPGHENHAARERDEIDAQTAASTGQRSASRAAAARASA